MRGKGAEQGFGVEQVPVVLAEKRATGPVDVLIEPGLVIGELVEGQTDFDDPTALAGDAQTAEAIGARTGEVGFQGANRRFGIQQIGDPEPGSALGNLKLAASELA